MRFLDRLVTGFFVAVFGAVWFITRKYEAPHGYNIVAYDCLGRQVIMDGIRTEFGTHAAAVSFVRQYKEAFPHHDFALESRMPSVKRLLPYYK